MKIQYMAFGSTLAVAFFFAACYANSDSSPPITPEAVPKATLSDVVLLLGSEEQALSVNSVVATGLRECFKFLVPFVPTDLETSFSLRRSALTSTSRFAYGHMSRSEENELVWRPPTPVLELARIAANSSSNFSRAIGGELREYLNPGGTKIPVPDVEGSNSTGCQPVSGSEAQISYCNNEVLDSYLSLLFRVIADRASGVGLNVTLNRFDLFHGHFLRDNNTRRLGILFHAQEHPVCGGNFPCPQTVPNCERGSNLIFNESSMNLRNILWLAPMPNKLGNALLPGVLVVLDARPDGIIYRDMVPGAKYARSIDEAGSVLVDVNYMNVAAEGADPDYKVIIA